MSSTNWFRTQWDGLKAFVRNRFWYIVVAGSSVFAGLVVAGIYGSVIDYTSSLGFCAHTCHEMESTVYQEYKHSKHFKNEQGVVVVCADCHVPHHNWPATFAAKAAASLELWPHFFGGESRTDVFEKRRYALAKQVWAHFAATNARECKSCHKFKNMILAEQNPAARAMHTQAMQTDANCLDCHKGITHNIPEEQTEGSPVAAATTVAQTQTARGEGVFTKTCAACHNALEPRLGDKAAWAPLIKQGSGTLVAAAIHGKGGMPPRGGNASLSDEDVKAAVDYMISKGQ